MHIVHEQTTEAITINSNTVLPNDTQYVQTKSDRLSSMEIYFLIVLILASLDAILGMVYCIISNKDARHHSSSSKRPSGYGTLNRKNEAAASNKTPNKSGKKGKMSARRTSQKSQTKEHQRKSNVHR